MVEQNLKKERKELKKKIFSVLLILMLMLSFGLVAPVMAESAGAPAAPITLQTNETFGEQVYSDPDIFESRITLNMPAGTTLGDIDSIAWSEYLVQGYPPHVDIILDLDGDSIPDDALVFEYAHNTSTHYAEGSPTYGAITGAWYKTFSDDDGGPVAITGTSTAWLSSGAPGPPSAEAFIDGTLADWKAGEISGSENADAIDEFTLVLRLEIEIDNWVVFTSAQVGDIQVTGPGVEATVEILDDVIQISVSPNTLPFGQVYRGQASDSIDVIIANTGTVPTGVTASTESAFYQEALRIDGSPVGTWSVLEILTSTNVVVPVLVDVPSDWPAGIETGTIIFWAEATP